MGVQNISSVEWKEAINTKLSKEEKNVIDTIKKETDKDKIAGLFEKIFNVPEGKKGPEDIETKRSLNFLYKSLIDQVYILYKSDKNSDLGRDDKTTLEIAFFLMKLYNPDKYANESGTFQSAYVKGDKKDVFYAAVEQDMGNIFNTKHALYEKFNTEKQIVDKDEYEKNKETYTKEGRKVKSESTVESAPEKISVDQEISDFPKQYFYRGQSDIDIERGIQDMVPSITAKIEELKKDADVDPSSIQLEVSSSVSNIKYFDNQALLGNRSNYMQSKLEKSFPEVIVTTNNPTYSDYGPEWGPSYPPTVGELNSVFAAGSEGLKALEKTGFTSMEDVAKSIADNHDKSQYFDVVEQYLYRDYQYAQVKVKYQKQVEVPKDKQVVELDKVKEKPSLSDGMLTWESGRVVAENPYYNGKPGIGVYEKINGVEFPLHAQYIELQLSDNKLTSPTKWNAITETTYAFKKQHTITNTELKERKSSKGVTASQELYLALDKEGVDLFSANLIKNSEDAGTSITRKETNKFINDYISTKEV